MSEHQCSVGCTHDSHEQEIQEEFQESRRGFIKEIFVGGATASLTSLAACAGPSTTFSGGRAGVKREETKVMHYYLPANADTVHWGYFSKLLKPLVEVESGDFVTIEALTHHANDDAERMIKGDPGVESVFYWDRQRKGVNRRGAGPMDHKLGAGGGLGVHICTGPVAVRGAEPGDVLEVRILNTVLRESSNPLYRGKAFGACAAANWGFHYNDQLEELKSAK